MAKRKLTKQQQHRIRQQHARRSERANRANDAAEELLSSTDLGPEQKGLVIARYGAQADVESLASAADAQSAIANAERCFLRANIGSVVTGDEVIYRNGDSNGDSNGVIVATEPRRSALYRPDPQGNLRPVAANIDRIFIVIAPEPEPFANLIDRYLVAAENQQIEAVLVLNKCDLITEQTREQLHTLVAPYRELGYQVVEASATTEHGLIDLKNLLSDHTSVFVGQSGVGKSSLINALLPEVNTAVGALSEARAKGTHTTTAARLFHLPSGGKLIDSPGIREFGLWHLNREQVAQGFVEFREHLGKCRFRDCTHEGEPGCALLAAEQNGDISPERMLSYRQIIQSLESEKM